MTGGGAPITPGDACLTPMGGPPSGGARETPVPLPTPAPLPFFACLPTAAFCGYGCADLRLGLGGGMCSPVPFFCTLRKYFCAWLRI